jgi:hypothetical protein
MRRQLDPLFTDVAGVAQVAYQRGYLKWEDPAPWSSLRVFFLGGGSKLPPLRERIRSAIKYPVVADPGQPEDLRTIQGRVFEGDPTFLLTAYGLSYTGDEVFEVIRPWEIDPLKPTNEGRKPKERPDRDELYPK